MPITYYTNEDVTNLKADALIITRGSGFARGVLKTNGESEVVSCLLKSGQIISPDDNKPLCGDIELYSVRGKRLDYKYIILLVLRSPKYDAEHINRRIINALDYAAQELRAKSIVIAMAAFRGYSQNKITNALDFWIKTVNPYMKAAVSVPTAITEDGFEKIFTKGQPDLPPAPKKEITITVKKEGLSEKIDELMGALSNSAIDIADYRIYDEKLTALREKYSHYNSKSKIKQQILSDYICGYISEEGRCASVLSEITGIEPSAISKYKNGDHAPRSKETAVALALGMELSEEDRYVLINALGHKYPDDKRDYCIELAARKGSYNSSEIIELIDGMFPEKTLYNYSTKDSSAALRR
ncbi:MAG: hypothetical protein ACI4KR_03460 [Ruminiclostridium sp.]